LVAVITGLTSLVDAFASALGTTAIRTWVAVVALGAVGAVHAALKRVATVLGTSDLVIAAQFLAHTAPAFVAGIRRSARVAIAAGSANFGLVDAEFPRSTGRGQTGIDGFAITVAYASAFVVAAFAGATQAGVLLSAGVPIVAAPLLDGPCTAGVHAARGGRARVVIGAFLVVDLVLAALHARTLGDEARVVGDTGDGVPLRQAFPLLAQRLAIADLGYGSGAVEAAKLAGLGLRHFAFAAVALEQMTGIRLTKFADAIGCLQAFWRRVGRVHDAVSIALVSGIAGVAIFKPAIRVLHIDRGAVADSPINLVETAIGGECGIGGKGCSV